jgi:hypothetical protein
MKLSSLALSASVIALGAAGSLASAQIERLDLAQMVAKTDNSLVGTIVGKEVIRIDHPVDGPELYFTTLTVRGTSLKDGKELTIDVTFPGGFIDAEHGVYNSEAPSADDIKTGNRVVAFYKWSENMGGDLSANALYASHGGIYRTFDNRKDVVVQGRGEGYAISANVTLSQLKQDVARLAKK